jgi:hypothetical protein
MLVNYWITSGSIKFNKKAFTQEILRKDSILKILLGMNSKEVLLGKSPALIKNEDCTIVVDFHLFTETQISEDPHELLKELKARYGTGVVGKLGFRSLYSTFNQTFYFEIDLDEHLLQYFS